MVSIAIIAIYSITLEKDIKEWLKFVTLGS